MWLCVGPTCDGQGDQVCRGDVVEEEFSLGEGHSVLLLVLHLTFVDRSSRKGTFLTLASTKSPISTKFPTHVACLRITYYKYDEGYDHDDEGG